MRVARRLVLALLVASLLLLGLEAALRITGLAPLEAPNSPLVFQNRHPDPAPAGPPRLLELGANPPVPMLQVPVGRRIVFLGGSATAGEGYTRYAAFPGQVERNLWALAPDQATEVVNLGAGGNSSYGVMSDVAQVIAKTPVDLLVVYSGNNEFLELRARKQSTPGYDSRAELLRRELSKVHLYRLLRSFFARPGLDPDDRSWMSVTKLSALADAKDHRLATHIYRENLTQMARVARAAEVPLLLVTVPGNLRGYHDPQAVLGAQAQQAAETLWEVSWRRDPSLDEVIRQTEPLLWSERGQYEMGRSMLAAGRFAAAREHFLAAEELATRPVRSTRAMRQALLEVAEAEGVVACDAAAALSAHSEHRLPGEDLFFDHCHPNALGHQRLGRALTDCILEQGLLGAPSAGALAPRALAAPTAWRLDHTTARRGHVDEDVLAAGGDPALVSTVRGHHAVLEGDYPAATRHYREALALGAPEAATLANLGLTWHHRGDLYEARHLLGEAVEAQPDDLELAQRHRVLGGRQPTSPERRPQ